MKNKFLLQTINFSIICMSISISLKAMEEDDLLPCQPITFNQGVPSTTTRWDDKKIIADGKTSRKIVEEAWRDGERASRKFGQPVKHVYGQKQKEDWHYHVAGRQQYCAWLVKELEYEPSYNYCENWHWLWACITCCRDRSCSISYDECPIQLYIRVPDPHSRRFVAHPDLYTKAAAKHIFEVENAAYQELSQPRSDIKLRKAILENDMNEVRLQDYIQRGLVGDPDIKNFKQNYGSFEGFRARQKAYLEAYLVTARTNRNKSTRNK